MESKTKIENSLKEKEEFSEREENRLKLILQEKRNKLLSPYVADCNLFSLGNISEETFKQLYLGVKIKYEKKISDRKKADEERVAREIQEATECEKQRLENIRLKKEIEEKEKQLKVEREKADTEKKAIQDKANVAKVQSEAKAKKAKELSDKKLAEKKSKADKLAAELKAKADAEIRAKKEKELEEKKMQYAPDKIKLENFANMLDKIRWEANLEFKSKEAATIFLNAISFIGKTSTYIEEKIKQL